MGAKKKTSAKGGHPALSMEEILAGLAARAPEGKRPGATSFTELEKLTVVPESLRALWSWSNGCDGLLCRLDPRDHPGDPIWDDLFSVKVAAKQLSMLREVALELLYEESDEEEPPGDADLELHLIPIGGENGSGDCLVLDTKTGRVHYWDHEQGDVDPEVLSVIAESLPALLARALDGETAPSK